MVSINSTSEEVRSLAQEVREVVEGQVSINSTSEEVRSLLLARGVITISESFH